jgi:hypothetical protein
MKAWHVKRMISPSGADQRLYRLEDGTHIVVSAAVDPYSGPETYIFPADERGEITGFAELDGSFRGALDHEQALNNAGHHLEQGRP